MTLPELTPQQAKVLHPDVRVVEAGPGSGKTRSLVARFLVETERCSGGVALLSFTNAATDEVRQRAAKSPAALKAPNFLGTIDSFLHRFVLTPWAVQAYGCRTHYHDTWALLPERLRRVRKKGVAGAGLRLDVFVPGEGKSARIDPELLDHHERKYVEALDAVGARAWSEQQAWRTIEASMHRGLFSARWARWATERILSGARGQEIVRRLALRFDVVLIDEMQDCVGWEFVLLTRLAGAGIRTAVVADPDQAIYEFRGGQPLLFTSYRDETHPDQVVELNKNHRSTDAICRAVSSLRCAGRTAIEATDKGSCAPVYALRGGPSRQRQEFEALLADHGIARDASIVLAHRTADALKTSGRAPSAADNAKAPGVRLARNCHLLRESPDTAIRATAIREVEDCLLELLDWPEGSAGTKRVRLEQLGRDSVWLRETAATFASALKTDRTPAAFAANARVFAEQHLADLPVEMRKLADCLKAPDAKRWKAAVQSVSDDLSLPCQTIHQSKGKEFAAVLLVINPRVTDDGATVLDDWETGTNTEARRVLYVGASRAEKLLVIGAGDHAARVAEQLERDSVPTELR